MLVDKNDKLSFDNYFKNHREYGHTKIVKNQEYYDNIFDDIDIKYIENYIRRKKLKNIK